MTMRRMWFKGNTDQPINVLADDAPLPGWKGYVTIYFTEGDQVSRMMQEVQLHPGWQPRQCSG